LDDLPAEGSIVGKQQRKERIRNRTSTFLD